MNKNKCFLCPRKCGADRKGGEKGLCNTSKEIIAARAALHMWEEPCISGENGSGAIFFSGCSLGCVYCQNFDISRGRAGKQITPERLYEIFSELEKKGANNINLVTAGHFLPQIIPVLQKAKKEGFPLPFVYNTSAYETEDAIHSLDGLIDIYLPDFKYASPSLANKYSSAPDYPEMAKKAIAEMVRQKEKCIFGENGIIKSGVIVRQLLLPKALLNSKAAVKYLYDTYGDRIYISLMSQYTPCVKTEFPALNQACSKVDYDELVNYAVDIGVKNGFIQDGESVSESFIPQFNLEGI